MVETTKSLLSPDHGSALSGNCINLEVQCGAYIHCFPTNYRRHFVVRCTSRASRLVMSLNTTGA